jgi:hypothetical protein
MSRRSTFAGCTPHAFSVLGGTLTGALVLIASGQGLTGAGMVYLLAGYLTGAVGGYLLAIGLGRLFGQWWHE